MVDYGSEWKAALKRFRSSPDYLTHANAVAKAITDAVAAGPGGTTEQVVQAIASHEAFVVKEAASMAVTLFTESVKSDLSMKGGEDAHADL